MFKWLNTLIFGPEVEKVELNEPLISRREHERELNKLYYQMVAIIIHKEELVQIAEAQLKAVLEERSR